MNFHIEDIVQKVKAWFPKAQAQIEAQAAELEARFNEQNYMPLSPEEVADYQNKIQSLSLPEVYNNAIQTKLSEVLTPWKKNKNSANHLFIVFSPVEPTQAIFKQTLEQVNDETLLRKSLSWETRPDDYLTLENQLQSQIESSEDSEGSDNNTNSQSLVIIPDLSLCFLRCVEGLDSVEYLFDLILKDHSRFWVVGCNQWAWNYFNYLYKVNSCFEHIFPLTSLNAVQLKQWLTPLYENLPIEFGDNNEENYENKANEWDEDQNWISKEEKQYFERLADISEGLSQPGAYLWLDSLRYVKQQEETNSKTVELQEDKQEKRLILKRATLPNLPELTKEDRYLLSSIGLHGEINLSALAVSLGEPESQIRIQVQGLLKTGLILQQQELLLLSSAYYPRLKRDLIDNQILAGEKD
ncbi:hypothetical protein M595_2620 [Lyngbya aestuarii BL J]|uniref:Uncharacterized protein n=1 Tax=Lyngbya aestuarii BL J TaxID=1348334 RepID=U7QJY9_9CYAN|nr:hypothetical protein [Lyngbya aestuarii]ERT07380.1 hypothetical protein M595_2620 [Lyngbya aestuarii BL J]